MKKILMLLLAVFGMSLLFSNCATVNCSNKPDWALNGSGAFPSDKGTKIYGVGIGESPMEQARKNAADFRARQELADTMQVSVTKLIDDYIDQHKDYFNPEIAAANELIQTKAKAVTDQELVGSQIIKRWECEAGNKMYSLGVLELDNAFYNAYKDKVKQLLIDKHWAATKAKSDEAGKNLDAAIDKQRAREKEILGVVEPKK